MNDDYDVVLDTLQKKRDALWKITESNMKCEFLGMNMMDDIRLEQIEQLDMAMDMWRAKVAIARSL